jgi:uncharacterized Fe-S center protein
LAESRVYFAKFDSNRTPDSAPELMGELFDAAGFGQILTEGDLTLVKLHFGEEGNKGYIRPGLVRTVVERCRAAGAKPFLCDTNTLYIRQRHNAVDHLALAARHGFTMESVGCPVIIADGLRGYNTLKVEVNGKHARTVNVAPDAVHADAIIGLAHVTGHIATGLGGAIKNIGMGLSSRAGKLVQHSGEAPTVDRQKCRACGICARWCPEDAITIDSDSAWIDAQSCVSCGYCICLCREGAIKFAWSADSQYLQERIAEHAAGVLAGKKGKLAFMNVIIGSTEKCDCMADTGRRLIKDLGLLASTDPVALDRATADVINEAAGKDVFREFQPDIDYECQLRHASELGLGSCAYKLVEV